MSPSKKYKLSLERSFYIWILLFFIGILGYLNYKILKSFFASAGWAIVIALVFHPVFDFLIRFLKYRGITAVLTIVLVIILFLLPFVYVSYQIILEAGQLIKNVNLPELINEIMNNPLLSKIIEKLSFITGGDIKSLVILIKNELSGLLKEGALKIAHGFGDMLSLIINLILTFFIAFFFLKDGDHFVRKIEEFLPFAEGDKIAIRNQIKNIIYTTFYGGILIAMLQGTILGVTFYFLDIPSSTLWGFATAVASFIPVLGAFTVWGPASIYLLVKGYILKGLILLLVGAFVISLIDNILKPIIIKGKVRLPLIFIFLSVLGGIKVFGLIGFIIGPLVFSLFVSFLEILKNFVGGSENV
ncbi:MAG: AI-2E family transporter [Thermodesulfovibrio sp.]|nr:AI-2E family transporter [Thermodesulfovibrio sp.]MDW7998910.1 AI-2E family transporter [Thermodesulfovibrio sp.]